MHLTGQFIADATGGILRGSAAGATAAGPIATDTRDLASGCWFLALMGPRFDGHAYAAQARAKGALGGIFSREPEGWEGPWVEVSNTTQALQDLARAVRRGLGVPVIALTGSSGKTSTRGMIAAAVGQLGRVHQTSGNLNNHLGVPMSLLATPEDAAVLVLELGTSSPGEIGFLAQMCAPDVGVVINVGPAHLEELGGLDGVAVEKGALLRALGSAGVAVVNADDPRVVGMPSPASHRLDWGRQGRVQLLDARIDPDTLGTHARYRIAADLHRSGAANVAAHQPAAAAPPEQVLDVVLALPGLHLAHNAGAALAVAAALGLDLSRAAADLSDWQPVGRRNRVEALPGGVRLLDDAYNANPASMVAALDLLAMLPGGRRVAWLGDMLELGPGSSAHHSEVVRAAVERGVDLLLLGGERFAAAGEGGGCPCWRGDPPELARRLADWLQPGDWVLVKGSRGARMERGIDALRAELAASPPGAAQTEQPHGEQA